MSCSTSVISVVASLTTGTKEEQDEVLWAGGIRGAEILCRLSAQYGDSKAHAWIDMFKDS
jgi:hypothetical protein